MCNKEREIDQIQKDLEKIEKTLNAPDGLVAKINNGISTEVPKLREAYEKLAKELRTHQLAHAKEEGSNSVHPDSNDRPKLPRIVGTIAIASIVAIVGGGMMVFGLWVMLTTGLINMEMIGEMIGAIWEKL